MKTTQPRHSLWAVCLGLAMLLGLLHCAGCALPFTGERNIKCHMNILGNTLEWESTVSGEYPTAGNTTVTP